MLKVSIPEQELWDEKTNTFVKVPKFDLQLEHSLVSISKWESKWHKPFLGKDEKTPDEVLDYIRCMTLNQNVDPTIYQWIPESVLTEISKYIEDPMTATTFNDNSKKRNTEIITNEIIYYWMVSFNIPFECQKWHLNRLLTLIRVCSIKNQPGEKMTTREILEQNRALNQLRKAQLHTRG